MWVVTEENYGGAYIVGKPGGEDIYDDRSEALAKRDEYRQTAEEAGQPCGYEVYELRRVG